MKHKNSKHIPNLLPKFGTFFFHEYLIKHIFNSERDKTIHVEVAKNTHNQWFFLWQNFAFI
jgi:hypothetical protein